jgi:hypothetical protein
MPTKYISFPLCFLTFLVLAYNGLAQNSDTLIGAEYVNKSLYKERQVLPDIYDVPNPGLQK